MEDADEHDDDESDRGPDRQATLGALDLLNVYVGDKLGLYRTLAELGPLTSGGLAGAAGIHERYAREWLEQQAAGGLLDVDDAAADATSRYYSLPLGHAEVLTDETSLNFVRPFGRAIVACVRPIDTLLEAFRAGDGVPFADYGHDLHEGQAQFTRPLFENLLGQEWLPALPEIHAQLQADPPARVADVACGEGRSSIAMARAYPNVLVDGIDLDEASISAARDHLAGSGVQDRVTLHLKDAADLERLLYGFSVLHCLPVGMVGDDPAGTGTVMRPGTVRRYGLAAGFSEVEILPIENDFWRFYRLVP